MAFFQGRAAGIGITSKAESSIVGEKMAITPTTAGDTNDKSDSSKSNQDCSSDEHTKVDNRRKSANPTFSNKKSSIDQQRKQNDKKSNNKKQKNEEAATDKSERSSSPAFDSDEDSSGHNNQQIQTLTVPTAATKKRPSIAGLLVSQKLYFMKIKLIFNFSGKPASYQQIGIGSFAHRVEC
jgi:hypothetical protein